MPPLRCLHYPGLPLSKVRKGLCRTNRAPQPPPTLQEVDGPSSLILASEEEAIIRYVTLASNLTDQKQRTASEMIGREINTLCP